MLCRDFFRRVAPFLLTLTTLHVLIAQTCAAEPRGKVDYNFHVRPLLSDRCFNCHGPDERARKAKLRLDTPEGARRVLTPGKPDESELITRICAEDDTRMPPRKSNLSLSREEVALLRRWVAEGAEFKPHWAFLPLPNAVPLPEIKDAKWPRQTLDRFVLARLEAEGLRPSPPAGKEDWIRRVTYDLTGLPPTPAQVDAFLADSSERAYEKVVDRLLAAPQFGERMASEWLDAARYADSFGYQADGDTHLWPWRDWVVSAFNRNLPYDQFLTWQLAGDLLPNATREQRLATAFNRLHRMTNEGGTIPEEFRIEYVSDRVHTVGTAVMGLTLECARCHDHKYDPFSMRDYYSLSAFFNNIDEWGTYDNSTFRPTPALALPTPAQEKEIEELRKTVQKAETRLRNLVKEREVAFRVWLSGGYHSPTLPGLIAHLPCEKVESSTQLANRANEKAPGTMSAANQLVSGKIGQALQFTGDDPATVPAPTRIDRDQPMTVAFWLWMPTMPQQAIIFHRQAGTDTGFHGVEMSLEAGRVQFALVRFWPGNAAAVRSRAPLPAKQWTHVAMSYDGSGRAAGIHLFLDGQPATSEIVRDGLTKDVQTSGNTLTFGERFRSTGLKQGKVDEIHVFGRELSAIEIAHLHDGQALSEALKKKDEDRLRPYFDLAVDVELARAREDLRQARQKQFAAETAIFEIMTMQEMGEPRPAHLLARGAYDAPRDRPVPRDTPTALPSFPNGAPRNRLGLAVWLTDPRHPLTARVAINRFWQMLFGRGFVATTENFGTQGALPTHPELLDWLAREFAGPSQRTNTTRSWDMKDLLKQIVLSATYRQRSSVSPELRERDPENLLLARGPSRRLSAEMLRDTALAASGLLVDKLGGPPARPYLPPGLWRGQNAFLPEYVPDKGEGLYRRSLYTFWRRTSPPPNMLALDAPSREFCLVKRQTTNTPLQPLVLLNDPQFVEAARALGERFLKEGGGTREAQLTFAFRLTASRFPTEAERRLLRRMYDEQREQYARDPASAQALLKVGDRPRAAGLDPIDVAAATATAGALLNLDASLMTR